MDEVTNGWDAFWDHGEAYLKTAVGGAKRSKIFTPDILYNICGMSIEGFFMGYLSYNHNLPENHTLRDLLRAGEKLITFPEDLRQRLKKMDQFQEICSIALYQRRIPMDSDVVEFINLAGDIRAFLAAQQLPVAEGRGAAVSD